MSSYPHQFPTYRLRLVNENDLDALQELYTHLNTCNGNPELCEHIIQESVESIQSRHLFKSIAFVIETLDQSRLVACARLIKIGDKNFPTMMYIEHPTGLQLMPYHENLIELAGAVVLPEYQRQGLGCALTAIRALMARLFSGVMGTEKVLAEFLPLYGEDQWTNDFWTYLVNECLDRELLTLALQKRVSRPLEHETDLAQVLLRQLDIPTRNQMINRYFPTWIHNVPEDVRHVIETVNPKSRGALINFQRIYAQIEKVGVFAIDGGSNYTALVQSGALGDRTVDCHFEEEFFVNRAIVFLPLTSRLSSLRSFEALICPGIFRPTFAKLSPITKPILEKWAEGDSLEEITYYQLPFS